MTTTITLPESTNPRPKRTLSVPVLVEVEPDGFLTVYAPRHVHAVVVQRIDDEGDGKSRTLADQFAELEVPTSHRAICDAAHIRATHFPRRRTVEGELAAREKLSALTVPLTILREHRRLKNLSKKEAANYGY